MARFGGISIDEESGFDTAFFISYFSEYFVAEGANFVSMDIISIGNTSNKLESYSYDDYMNEVSRILSTLGKKAVDSNGVSLYSDIRLKSNDKWSIIEYISDACMLIEGKIGKYSKIETVEVVETGGITYRMPSVDISCPLWMQVNQMNEVKHSLNFFMIRYIVAKKVEDVLPKDSERFMEAAKLHLEEAKRIFYTKAAPVFPVQENKSEQN